MSSTPSPPCIHRKSRPQRTCRFLPVERQVSDTELVAIADTEMNVNIDAQVAFTTTAVAENPNPTLQQHKIPNPAQVIDVAFIVLDYMYFIRVISHR